MRGRLGGSLLPGNHGLARHLCTYLSQQCGLEERTGLGEEVEILKGRSGYYLGERNAKCTIDINFIMHAWLCHHPPLFPVHHVSFVTKARLGTAHLAPEGGIFWQRDAVKVATALGSSRYSACTCKGIHRAKGKRGPWSMSGPSIAVAAPSFQG